MRHVIPVLAGVLFGFGLDLSQMTDPERVLGFLDVTGVRDPTLVFVLAGAFLTSAIGFRTLLRGNQSWYAGECSLPGSRTIDGQLVAGAAVFGLGWGIAGYCPGPAIAALGIHWQEALPFLTALAIGGWSVDLFDDR